MQALTGSQMLSSRQVVTPAQAGTRSLPAARGLPSLPVRRPAVVVRANENQTSTEEKPEIAKVL